MFFFFIIQILPYSIFTSKCPYLFTKMKLLFSCLDPSRNTTLERRCVDVKTLKKDVIIVLFWRRIPAWIYFFFKFWKLKDESIDWFRLESTSNLKIKIFKKKNRKIFTWWKLSTRGSKFLLISTQIVIWTRLNWFWKVYTCNNEEDFRL